MVTPKEYVSAALKTEGIESDTYGHWKHKLIALLSNDVFLSLFGEKFTMKLVFNQIKKLRSNYYKQK